MVAAGSGHSAVVTLLLQLGADLEATTKKVGYHVRPTAPEWFQYLSMHGSMYVLLEMPISMLVSSTIYISYILAGVYVDVLVYIYDGCGAFLICNRAVLLR